MLKGEIGDVAVRSCVDPVGRAIQSHGALIVYCPDDGLIRHVSANVSVFMGRPADALLDTPIASVLSRQIVHAINNAVGRSGFARSRLGVGNFELTGGLLRLSVAPCGPLIAVEAEPEAAKPPNALDFARDLDSVLAVIADAQSRDVLIDATARILRLATGYDRVMVCRDQGAAGGVVLGESRRATAAPNVGRRFAPGDGAFTVGCLCDSTAATIPILGVTNSPPDIRFTALRAPSNGQIRSLRDLDAEAMLSLAVMRDNNHWGTMVFHHGRARRPVPQMQDMLVLALRVFAVKLTTFGA